MKSGPGRGIVLIGILLFFAVAVSHGGGGDTEPEQADSRNHPPEISLENETAGNNANNLKTDSDMDTSTGKSTVEDVKQRAEQGEAEAQFKLGALYKNGEGVEQNYDKALEWYTKSAEQGYADAQVILGAMYYTGQGVEQDKSKAFEWWSKAAAQDNEAGKRSLDMLCSESPWLCK
ncbi:MAG: tetratricopeptide repeat protein [Desulfobulbaceae bacterium]|jgi:TPR repeat protein|nr:tetratricopeptide repeat protein [Desulfobulbaceae bacterium]